MRFDVLKENVFQEIQVGAGILLTEFNTSSDGSFEKSNIIGATSGGIQFSDTPAYTDFGEDIDNCSKNTKQLKKVESREIKMSGTFVSVDTKLAKMLIATADVSSEKITVRNDLLETDFQNIWWVANYSDKNGATKGGFIAVKMLNALSTAGFSLQTTDKAKGQFAFEFTAHYDLNSPETVPYEMYIHKGQNEGDSFLSLAKDEEN